MQIIQKINNIFTLISKRGFSYFFIVCFDRIIDTFYELYLNVDTEGYVFKKELGIYHPDSNEYATIPYRHISSALGSLKIDKASSTLLDYGCCKGRVLAYAAFCNFQRIIGVENSRLIEIAEKNIKQMSHQKTSNILLEKCDAQNFNIHSSVDIIFFYNPFVGTILEQVIQNIYSSYQESPRRITIIYFNNNAFERIIFNYDWIKKIDQSQPHPDFSCGIYEIGIS